jgi:hypothetical protein
MAYKPGIPLSTDYISQSQIDFINNFDTVNKTYGLSVDPNQNVGDHVSLTETNEDLIGKHKKTTLIKQASDPTVGASELALYSKGTTPDLYYLRSTDASANRLTSGGAVSIAGLVLRAYVLFDFNGKIISNSYVDSEGTKTEVPVKFNIASVSEPAEFADWTVTFTDSMVTSNYFWVAQGMGAPKSPIAAITYFQVKNGAYASSVTPTSIKLSAYLKSGALASKLLVPRILLQVYTVAS